MSTSVVVEICLPERSTRGTRENLSSFGVSQEACELDIVRKGPWMRERRLTCEEKRAAVLGSRTCQENALA